MPAAKCRLFSLATTTNSTFDSYEPPYNSIGLGVINYWWLLVFNVQSINTLMLQLYQMNWASKRCKALIYKRMNKIFFLYYFYSRRGLPWQWPTQSNLVVATILVTYLDKLLISYVCNKISKSNYFLALTNSSFLIVFEPHFPSSLQEENRSYTLKPSQAKIKSIVCK